MPAHIALEIKSGIENLKAMAKTSSSPAAKQEKDMYDVADEIREVKELLEDELITLEEFDAKKSNCYRFRCLKFTSYPKIN